MIALLRGHLRWAFLTSRTRASGALAGALALLVLGSLLDPRPPAAVTLEAAGEPPSSVTTSTPAPLRTTPGTTPRTSEPSATPPPASAYYKNCTEAKAAGVAPLHVGDPGYRAALDRDGDGVGCET